MQIQYKNNGVIKHVSQEVGGGFIDAGLAVEIPTTKAAPIPNLQWAVRRGSYIGDYQCPPVIYHVCSTCGAKGMSEGPTVHLTHEVRHCGIVEKVLKAIAKQYLELLKPYQGRQRRYKPEHGMSGVALDQALATARAKAGLPPIKSRQDLIAEQLAVERLAKK